MSDMKLEDAIASVNQSLERGDKLCQTTGWSGGNFKSDAIRTVLAALETRTPISRLCDGAGRTDKGDAASGDYRVERRHD